MRHIEIHLNNTIPPWGFHCFAYIFPSVLGMSRNSCIDLSSWNPVLVSLSLPLPGFQTHLEGDWSALWWRLISILISLCFSSSSSVFSTPLSLSRHPGLSSNPTHTPNPVLVTCLSIGLFVQTMADPLTTPHKSGSLWRLQMSMKTNEGVSPRPSHPVWNMIFHGSVPPRDCRMMPELIEPFQRCIYQQYCVWHHVRNQQRCCFPYWTIYNHFLSWIGLQFRFNSTGCLLPVRLSVLHCTWCGVHVSPT